MAPAWSLSGSGVTSALPDQNLPKKLPLRHTSNQSEPSTGLLFRLITQESGDNARVFFSCLCWQSAGDGVLQARRSRLTTPGVERTGKEKGSRLCGATPLFSPFCCWSSFCSSLWRGMGTPPLGVQKVERL